MKKLLSDNHVLFGLVSCGFYLATYIAIQADFGGHLERLLFADNHEKNRNVAKIGSVLPASGEASSKP